MKNNFTIRLLLLTFAVCTFLGTRAQTTILFQNFEASKTVAPTGWTQQLAANDPTNKGWKFSNKFAGSLASYVPAHTYYAYVNDYQYNTTAVANNDTLYSPSFSCVGNSHVFISFDAMYYEYTGYEVPTIAVSVDGGATWTTADTIPTNNFTWQDSLVYDISSIAANQSNVEVAFTYFDGCPNPYASQGVGIAIDNIDVFTPLNYDLGVAYQNLPYLMQVGTAYTFTGGIYNYGGDSITAMTLNYSVNGGTPQTDNITGITGFNALTYYSFTHSVAFTPSAAGVYTVKFWATNLNGSNIDQFHANDTLTASFMALTTIQPRVALYEDVVGQSCYYCMLAAPNVDSVSASNPTGCNIIHYHVPYPGPPDYMYDAATSVGDSMTSYYNVQGTPQGELDGQSLYPGALAAPQDFSTPYVASEVTVGSAVSIKINSCSYTAATNTFSLNADITAYGNIPAGLSAKVVLTVDSITYTEDYSSDDPTSGFEPPIGNTSGGDPDYLFPYLLKFPTVAEAQIPSNKGTALTAFTAGQTQNINVSWVKNHAWSDSAKQYPYDSSSTVHMVVFVQSDAGIPSVGIPAQYVLQSASAMISNVQSVQEFSNGVSFNMYPNPGNGYTNLVFNLAQEQNVSVSVFNILGEEVYSADKGRMSAGQHDITIEAGNLSAGIYTVRVTTDNATSTQKLIIQR